MKENGIFDKIANFVVKRPKAIVAVWLVVLLISIGVVVTQPSTLSYDMTTMEMKDTPESVIGGEIMADEGLFYQDSSTYMGTIIVIQYTDATALADFISALEVKMTDHYQNTTHLVEEIILPGTALYGVQYDPANTGTDEVSTLRGLINDAKAQLTEAERNDLTTYVTGSDPIGYDTEASAMKDVKKIDPISIFLILVLIGLFFRSFVAAATPPLVVGAAYGIMMCLLIGLGSIMEIFYITPILMLVSMLGAGCDYSIFIISRYREERKSGKNKEAALHESVKWAGESVATSGLSVIIGFGVLSFCSFSMISTMGIVLALGIVVALLAALTFIPSILMLVGDKVFFPSKIETYQEGSKAMSGWYGNWSRRGQRYFQSTAKHAIKYAKPIVIAAVLITVPLAYVALTEETSYDMIGAMPPGESKEGIDVIVDTVGGGVIMPTYMVTELRDSLATVTPDPNDPSTGTLNWNTATFTNYQDLLNEIDSDIMALDNISSMLSLNMYHMMELPVQGYLAASDKAVYLADLISQLRSAGFDEDTAIAIADLVKKYGDALSGYSDIPTAMAAYRYGAYTSGLISVDGLYTKTTIIMQDEPMSNRSMNTILSLRDLMSGIKGSDSNGYIVGTWVTGSAAATYDISNIVNDEFKWIEIGVVVLIFLLLFFVLKSYFTPLRAILTILMSIVWTVGLTHLVFGHLLGIPVLWMIPIILLVVCLGLGMDYDILLTTRIRENVLKGMSNDESITHALEKSGAVITLCGLIMAGTFSTLMLSTTPMLQEFGFALGFAILVDALIVRTYIVPALMHLMGDWNWKGPKWLHREKKKEVPAEEPSSE